MNICFSRTFSLFFLFFLAVTTTALAQQNPVVHLDGAKMRAALELPKGTSMVSICGLEPGNTYILVATGAAYGQRADFEIAPAPALTKGASNFAYMREKKNAVRFAAPSPCVDIQVNTMSYEQGDRAPMYLSIKCESCPEANDWLKKVTGQADFATIQVEGGYSAEELVKDVLVGGGCFQVSDVSYFGQGEQIGKFSSGITNVGFNEGVVIATGNIQVAVGPNDSDGASQGYGIVTPDAELGSLTNGNTFDMADIEFDFVPTQNQVVFEYVFASEEYCEYVNSQFNDVFGFFISGPGIAGTQNIALIPSTNTPVAINNVNHLTNSGFYTHNTPLFGMNCGILPAFGQAVQELQYDGFTKKFVATANVVPCQKYHIKLKIADVGDGVWDSAVFLRANSFDAGGEVLATPAYPGSFGSAYESCDAGGILFKRGNGSSINQPLVVSFSVGGTATPGVDYVPITSPVIIPAGQTELFLPVQVIPDLIIESAESILLVIPNACTCTQGQVEFLIKDRPQLQAQADNQVLCEGEIATLQASVSGGFPDAHLIYQWSTGETTETISPTTTGTYTLTITDGCSVPAIVSIELVFNACGCASETFIQTIGQEGQNVRGYGIYDSHDGNLYITGLKQDSAMIVKMTPAGTVLWTRSFDVQSAVNDNISELIVDSEGMLVGCGQSGDVQPIASGFVFRYNPATNTMQWINTFSNASPYVMGLIELANGNYLVYDNPHAPSNDNRMLEITRADGTIDLSSPLSQQLNLGGADNFNSAVALDGKLYGVGRYTNGVDFTNMRHALSRVNLTNGNVEWSRLSHIAPDFAARLYGMDLLIEDNNIISVSFGSETDGNLTDNRIFLQKTGLGGNLIWVKRFDLLETADEAVEEVVSVPDGYILYARGSSAPSDLYLIKTDKNGVFQWSKKVDFGFNDYVGAVSNFQSQILVHGSHLFFMASTEGSANSQMLVVKTTLDGAVEGNCDYIQPTLVAASDVADPVNFGVVLQQVPFNEEVSTLVLAPQNIALAQTNQCKVFINEFYDVVICPGKSFTLDGVVYTQDTTFNIEVPGAGGCDTLRMYTISTAPYPTRTEDISLCPGGSVNIGGVVYNQTGTVVDTLPSLNGCDTIVTYNITVQPEITRAEDISFCPGGSATIDGQVYTQSGVVVSTVPGINACDTVVTYTLTLLPYQTNAQTALFCAGQSVNIGGVVYTQPGVVVDTVPTATGCDIIVTYTLVQLPYQTRAESISFCPGGSVTIGGQVYNQSGTVIDTVPALTGAGCDTIVTYTLTLLPQPTLSETIVFCPGETVVLGGNTYTQPGTVVRTLPSTTGGCDTIATYTLQYATPAPSNVSITCPGAITIGQPSGSSGAVVNFALPTASSDCPCPGIDLSMTSGLPSGSLFPSGTTSVCYAAKDSCGQTATCCFKVTIQEDDPCDTKVNGCIKYELLTITEDAGKNRTYRIRVTNNCTNKLIYTAIQQPDGMVAIEPDNFATYTAPSGNTYRVRNPNFTPQYSIRYSSLSDSINNGESDIFKYTLPAQTNAVTFIHVVSRLAPYIYLGAHLNTFYCPIGVTPTDDRPAGEERDLSGLFEVGMTSELLVFPNPTSGDVFADFSPWRGERLSVQVMDSRGQQVKQFSLTAGEDAQAIELPAELPNGLYFLEMLTGDGTRYRGRFVVQR